MSRVLVLRLPTWINCRPEGYDVYGDVNKQSALGGGAVQQGKPIGAGYRGPPLYQEGPNKGMPIPQTKRPPLARTQTQRVVRVNDDESAQCFAVCAVMGACMSIMLLMLGVMSLVAFNDSKINNGELDESHRDTAITYLTFGALIQVGLTLIAMFRFRRWDAWTNIVALTFWICLIMSLGEFMSNL